MKINLLYFDGCPSWQNALKNLEIALKEENLNISVSLIKVGSNEEAVSYKFLGSPSFRMNDNDFWPDERTSYSMSCRVYSTPEGLRGWPSVEMLRQKLQAIVSKPSS
jgi:hypothetical protein